MNIFNLKYDGKYFGGVIYTCRNDYIVAKNTLIKKTSKERFINFLQLSNKFTIPLIFSNNINVKLLLPEEMYISKKFVLDKIKLIVKSNFVVLPFFSSVSGDHIDLHFSSRTNFEKYVHLKRLEYVVKKIFLFFKKYEMKIDQSKLDIIIFNEDIDDNIVISEECLPDPESHIMDYTKKISFIIFKILKFLLKCDNNIITIGYVKFLSNYIENYIFDNSKEILERIHDDYENNSKKDTYLILHLLSDSVSTTSNLFSDFYTKLILSMINIPFTTSIFLDFFSKNFGKNINEIKNQINAYLSNPYPLFKIIVEKVEMEHICSLKINIKQINGEFFKGTIEATISEFSGIGRICFSIHERENNYYYITRGRRTKYQKGREGRKTAPPKPNYSWIGFNSNGKLPCNIILEEDINYTCKKLCQDSNFWTKIDTLKQMTRQNSLVNSNGKILELNRISSFINETLLSNISYELAIHLLYLIFGRDKCVKYVLLESKSETIKFCIGLYLKLFCNEKKHSPIDWRNGRRNYILRRELLKYISYKKNDITMKFLEEVSEELDFELDVIPDFYIVLVNAILFQLTKTPTPKWVINVILKWYNPVSKVWSNEEKTQFFAIIDSHQKNGVINFGVNDFL